MKISKYTLLPILITVILFIIPFFWLKPGEMDLGGDGNRLYFYDPVSYLQSHTPYNVIPTGLGGDAISYYALPFISLLALARFIISATFVISILNGIKLSIAFISCYFIVKDLVKRESYGRGIIEISAVIAGIFYIFLPILINSGWDKAILSHIQIFLNPLMFLLILRYFTTRNIFYLLTSLFVSFVFSLNFSYAAAPPFFAFYPLSFLFIFLYAKFIRKTPVPIKGLFIGGLLALMLNAFHLVPHILSILSFGGDMSGSVFADQTKFTRGLDYFTGIAPSVKVSIGLLNLAQLREIVPLSFAFIVFPAIILLGFLWNKHNKTLLLTGAFFLIVTFFATASVTDIGFNFYKALFYVPGFKMFRNFFAQWSFAQVFFYTLLFGQVLAIVLQHTKKIYRIFLLIFILITLSITAWPLLSGTFTNSINWLSKDIKVVIKMDPVYEKVLSFVRNYPTDGKILSLPLTGSSYQVLAGKDGGAYVGPPMFSYLAGRNDFAGYQGLDPYGEIFLQAAKNGDYELFQKLFSLLNIKYIFYNSDTKIYDDNFKGFPYDYVKDFLPKNQESYKTFIQKLPVDEKIDFGDKYHFYRISDTVFLPHVFTTTHTNYTNDPLNFQFISSFNKERRSAVFNLEAITSGTNTIFLEAKNINPLLNILKNEHLHHHEPYISLSPSQIYYPLIPYREKLDLLQLKNEHEKYVDLALFYLSKRIYELDKWGRKMSILQNAWEEPKLWEFYKWKTYNSWEASFARYENSARGFIRWINDSVESDSWKKTMLIKLKEQLYQHHLQVILNIKGSGKKEEDKVYLLFLANKTFNDLIKEIETEVFVSGNIPYTLNIPLEQQGEYEVYLENRDNISPEISIEFEDKLLRPLKDKTIGNVMQFNNVVINSQKEIAFTLHISPQNIISNSDWKTSGDTKNEKTVSELQVYNLNGNRQIKIAKDTGVIQEVHNLRPNKQYLISFDYLTFGDDFILSFYERFFKTDEKKVLVANEVLQRLLNATTWKNHQAIFTSSSNIEHGILQFTGSNDKVNSEIYIKNLSVVEIAYPKIFFKKIVSENKEAAMPPKIIFTKINPTKYRINVAEAKNPYTLVFLEAFNVNWKLKDPQKDTPGIVRRITRTLGATGKLLTSMFIKDVSDNGKITESHFDGDVKEGVHRRTFLEPSTFETWGKETIADEKHFRVNGYANAWNIDPGDLDGKTDYTLILEMRTQKQFYLLLPLSISTAILLFIFSLLRIFRKNEKNS